MSTTRRNVSRRDFLKITGGTLAAAGALGFRAPLIDSKIPIATQMWCVRHESATDLPGVLAALAEMGYQGVEFADDYFNHSVRDIRRLLDRNHLQVAGNHIYFDSLLGDRLPATIELHETLGAKNLIVRSLRREQYSSRDAILKLSDQLNEISDRLRPHGMRTGFHNHSEIFNSFDGELAWNILADHTRPDFILQLDTGNAMQAPQEVDLLELIRRNAGRTVTTHIKPHSRANRAAYLGQDELPWGEIIRLMETVGGTEWYIIEYEIEGTPPLEALKDNLDIFKKLVAAA